MKRAAILIALVAIVIAGVLVLRPSGEEAPTPKTLDPDVIFVATPPKAVEAMLDLAGVKEGDVVYDLGSGDGRIPIAAARRPGVRAVGIEIDPALVRDSRQKARAAGVADRVEFRQQDLFQSDFSDATVVTLFLLGSLNDRLRPMLENQLKPGTRVVTYVFQMDGWTPDRVIEVDGKPIYLYTIK